MEEETTRLTGKQVRCKKFALGWISRDCGVKSALVRLLRLSIWSGFMAFRCLSLNKRVSCNIERSIDTS